jgi:hypothetical protein
MSDSSRTATPNGSRKADQHLKSANEIRTELEQLRSRLAELTEPSRELVYLLNELPKRIARGERQEAMAILAELKAIHSE